MNLQSSFPVLDRKAHEIIAFHHGVEVKAQEFLSRALALSKRLPPNKFVFNLCTDRFQYLLAFCATTIAGQCTLMPPNRLPATLQQLGSEYPDYYLLSNEDVSEWDKSAGQTLTDSPFEIPAIPADQLCAVAFTSGSTGLPTPNLKYWKTLRTGSLGNAQLLLPPTNQRLNVIATVPPQHMWGLEMSILLPLFSNVAISDRTPFYPQDIADALLALPEPRAMVSSPVHLNVLLKSKVQVAELEYIFSATAPMSQQSAEQLERQFGTRVIEVFGSSESGIVARRETSAEVLWRLSDLFTLEICDSGVSIQAQHLPAEVFIRDAIEMVGDKQFRWLGRHQDMLNIAGNRGSLADLNKRLLSVKGVVDGVMFLPHGESERVAAMVVAPGLQAKEILTGLKSEVESIFLPRPLLMVDDLPRQATGKLANRDILEKFSKLIAKPHKVKST